MDSSDSFDSHGLDSLAISAARVAELVKKNVELVLAAARWEKQVKTLTGAARRKASTKATLEKYFSSSWGSSPGQPLAMVLDSRYPDVPGAESDGVGDYPSSDSTGACEKTVSIDTTPGSSIASGDTQILSSKSPLIALLDSSEGNCGLKEVSNASEGEDDEADSPPRKKGATVKGKAETAKTKAQQRYDRHQKFQTEWAAKLPWAEGILATDGVLHMVRCKVCSEFDRKPCVMAPKSDTLLKHDGKRTAKRDLLQFGVKKGKHYIANQCKHRKNLRLYAARAPSTVFEQVLHCTTVESRRKRVQFATLFQVLQSGRPMLEFESRQSLYKLLSVPDLPSAHWCDNSGWIMASFMHKVVVQEIQKLVNKANFVAVTVDEVTAVDTGSYLSVHCYVMRDWVRVPLLVALQHVDCAATAENLTKLIVDFVVTGAALETKDLAAKLISFGCDGASNLSGVHTRVIVQIKDSFAPFCHGVHCVAHRCNLAFKALESLGIFESIGKVLRVTHAYFNRSPKRLTQFRALAGLTETKGLKMLKRVETCWVSFIEPLRRLLSEYRTLIYTMTADLDDNDKAQACLLLLLDPYTMLGMVALLPLLDAVDSLVNFAQKRDVFICDFIAAIKICQASLHSMYEDPSTGFSTDEFWSFQNLLDCSHEQIHLKWITDLNDDSAVLSFVCHGEKIHAEHKMAPVDRTVWDNLVAQVKAECTTAATKLIAELDSRFPAQNVMSALGITYPQFWFDGNAEEQFDSHLRVLMDTYGHEKVLGLGSKKMMLLPLINRDLLMSQRGLFKMCMKSNARAAMLPPFDVNPLTKVWRVLDGNNNLTKNFSEFIKLAEIAITHVIGSMEDERTFSSLSFLKSKLRANLVENLEVAVGMYSQNIFILENFPYQKVFEEWFTARSRGRYLSHA